MQVNNHHAKFLVKLDKICDYIPIISTISNIVDIIQKRVFLLNMQKSKIDSNHYFKHLNNKSITACIVFAVPFGRICFTILDKCSELMMACSRGH